MILELDFALCGTKKFYILHTTDQYSSTSRKPTYVTMMVDDVLSARILNGEKIHEKLK